MTIYPNIRSVTDRSLEEDRPSLLDLPTDILYIINDCLSDTPITQCRFRNMVAVKIRNLFVPDKGGCPGLYKNKKIIHFLLVLHSILYGTLFLPFETTPRYPNELPYETFMELWKKVFTVWKKFTGRECKELKGLLVVCKYEEKLPKHADLPEMMHGWATYKLLSTFTEHNSDPSPSENVNRLPIHPNFSVLDKLSCKDLLFYFEFSLKELKKDEIYCFNHQHLISYFIQYACQKSRPIVNRTMLTILQWLEANIKPNGREVFIIKLLCFIKNQLNKKHAEAFMDFMQHRSYSQTAINMAVLIMGNKAPHRLSENDHNALLVTLTQRFTSFIQECAKEIGEDPNSDTVTIITTYLQHPNLPFPDTCISAEFFVHMLKKLIELIDNGQGDIPYLPHFTHDGQVEVKDISALFDKLPYDKQDKICSTLIKKEPDLEVVLRHVTLGHLGKTHDITMRSAECIAQKYRSNKNLLKRVAEYLNKARFFYKDSIFASHYLFHILATFTPLIQDQFLDLMTPKERERFFFYMSRIHPNFYKKLLSAEYDLSVIDHFYDYDFHVVDHFCQNYPEMKKMELTCKKKRYRLTLDLDYPSNYNICLDEIDELTYANKPLYKRLMLKETC